MAKSVGNIFLLHETLAAYGRDALIMYFCGGHYRQPIAFSHERLEEAGAAVGRIREAARRLLPGPSPQWSSPLRERFFAALKKFDDYLASTQPLQVPAEKLFQGPVADALTHVGQLAMLRRLVFGRIFGRRRGWGGPRGRCRRRR